MEEQKKPRGRPPTPEDKVLLMRSIRLTREQWAKVDAAGLRALRQLIDRWKPKQP
ncbi:hypothetical protein [Diaphorobacter sp. J5-51]|uniref:hypothetical protein n=1 Tax=Diaphorobacter sp. J5-51 TaxID=680496 RepID=UPI0012F99444|nr:hypothetical protein [Diaphorobacter sp. J5-51]